MAVQAVSPVSFGVRPHLALSYLLQSPLDLPFKAKSNSGKHRVTFEEALSAFRDPLSLTIPDPDHSESEDRLILMGLSDRQRLLVVVYVERDENLRLISARAADPDEKREYEEEP